MTDCYVAFLDLLGVRGLVKAAARDESLHGRLVAALEAARDTSRFRGERRDLDSDEEGSWALQVQAFSDSVVLFVPVESGLLPWLLASVRRLHDDLLRLGVAVRGGIAIGGMHWEPVWGERAAAGDDRPPTPIAFGPGLVAAYDLESGAAVYPRILVSNGLYEHVRDSHPRKAFPLGAGHLLGFLRQDFDGLRHLDVLHPAVHRNDVTGMTSETEGGMTRLRAVRRETTYPVWLEEVRRFIEAGRGGATSEKVEAKYLWLARYFNEMAAEAGVPPLPWFEDVDGAAGLTLTTRTPNE